MVSGDTVYQITYYASDVYMLQKTGYIYININKNYFKPITFFIVLGGVGNEYTFDNGCFAKCTYIDISTISVHWRKLL